MLKPQITLLEKIALGLNLGFDFVSNRAKISNRTDASTSSLWAEPLS